MYCLRSSEELASLMDGELLPAQAADLHRHVAGCAACRRELSRLRQTAGLVGALAEVAPPQDLRARVQQKAALARPAALTCSSARELLDEYAHGEVADEMADSVVAHLNECAPCGREMARLDETAGLLTALSPVDPPARIRQRMQAEVARRSRPVYARPTFRGLAATAATAVAAAAVMIALRIPTVTERPVVASHPSPSATNPTAIAPPASPAAPRPSAALTPAAPTPTGSRVTGAARPVTTTAGAVAVRPRTERASDVRQRPASTAAAMTALMRNAAAHLAPGAFLDTPIAGVPMETPAPHVTTASAGPAMEPEPAAATAEVPPPHPAREVTVAAAAPAVESPLSEVRRVLNSAPRANPPTLRPKHQPDRLASSPISPWGF